jgi:hypothetical protein
MIRGRINNSNSNSNSNNRFSFSCISTKNRFVFGKNVSGNEKNGRVMMTFFMTSSKQSLTNARNTNQRQKKTSEERWESYRQKHGYDWDGKNEARMNEAREAANKWMCTVARQGYTSPIDFTRVKFDKERSSRNVPDSFRGTLLEDEFINNKQVIEYITTRRGPTQGRLTNALIYVHGIEAYEKYLEKHIVKHVRMARRLKLWRINWHVVNGREPNYEDVPETVRLLELQYINLGFKLREFD